MPWMYVLRTDKTLIIENFANTFLQKTFLSFSVMLLQNLLNGSDLTLPS